MTITYCLISYSYQIKVSARFRLASSSTDLGEHVLSQIHAGLVSNLDSTDMQVVYDVLYTFGIASWRGA